MRLSSYLLLLLICGIACSANAGGVAPNAGSIIQDLKPGELQPLQSNKPALRDAEAADQNLDDSVSFKLNQIKIVGNKIFDQETLYELVKDFEHQDVSLKKLGEIASVITKFYQSKDYPLSYAIIPAQTAENGNIVIEIVEASFGQVKLNNKSKVKDSVLMGSLKSLKGDAPVIGKDLNKSLLLVTDIPGIGIGTSLAKGEKPATTDILINIKDSGWGRAFISSSNSGSESIGRVRENAGISFFNLLGRGDDLSVNVMSSFKGMNYGRVSYDFLVGDTDVRAGGAYSQLDYSLGDEYKIMKANGSTEIYDAWLKKSISRGTNFNLYSSVQYERMNLKDRIDLVDIRTDRYIDSFIFSLSGDLKDSFFKEATNVWSTSVTSGDLHYQNDSAKSADATSANTQGRFTKINLYFARHQSLSEDLTLYLGYKGQLSSGNLDPSKKILVGGPSSLRAYDVGTISADTGHIFTIELKQLFASSWGTFQPLIFYDAANVKINKDAWVDGENYATLQGVGFGVNWQNDSRWSVKASFAKPVGGESSLIPSSAIHSRSWLEVRKDF